MTISLVAAPDGLSGTIQVGGVDKVVIGADGITPASLAQKLTSGTAVATTSGTSVDFTGIPSWAKRITVLMSGVSTNGASLLQAQIGDVGGIENTGYLGSGSYMVSGVGTVALTSGLNLTGALGVSTAVHHGKFVFELVDAATNTWVGSSIITRSDAASAFIATCSKSLSATLDRVRLATINGTDTFDAGSVNVLYEG